MKHGCITSISGMSLSAVRVNNGVMKWKKSNILIIAILLISNICTGQFTKVFTVPNLDGVNALCANNSFIFLGTGGQGIFRSTDNGDTWVDINNGISNWYYFSLLSNNDSLFAGSFGHVVFSTNNGDTWSDLQIGLGLNDCIYSLARKGQSLYAGVKQKGIYVSQIGSTNWIVKNNGLHANPTVNDIIFLGNDIYAATDKGVYKSSDNASSWNLTSSGLPLNTEVNKLFFYNFVLFAGTATGAYKSNDLGNTWMETSNGLPGSSNIRCFSVLNDSVYIGTYSSVFVSTNLGNNWTIFNSGLPGTIAIFASTIFNNYLYVGNNCIYRHTSSTVGIRNIDDNNDFTFVAYPNPATDYITLELSTVNNKNLAILDMFGKEVKIIDSEEKKITIDLSSLKKGAYFIQYKNDNFFTVKKVVKM
jgi:photosystem II stability/assembly factor-like uncharacterized protein